jgi:hypothetical protein
MQEKRVLIIDANSGSSGFAESFPEWCAVRRIGAHDIAAGKQIERWPHRDREQDRFVK